MPPHTPASPRAPEPLEDTNLVSSDTALSEAAGREGANTALKRLSGFGLVMGSSGTAELARAAARNRPRLEGFDRAGHPVNRIVSHPAFGELLQLSAAEGLRTPAASSTTPSPVRAGANVERAAQIYVAAQADAGHVRNITMTHAGLALIEDTPEIVSQWLPKLVARAYDGQDGPIDGKTAAHVTVSLAAIEALRTPSQNLAKTSAGARIEVSGLLQHVWSPDADAVIALIEDGIPVIIPRYRADGRANAITIRAMNSTLGLVSLANADVACDGAEAYTLTANTSVTKALMHQRLDGAAALTGLMHRALAEAIFASRFGFANGMGLGQRTLVQQTLADMALDCEAAIVLVFRLARAFDRASDARAAAWRRLMSPVTACFISKLAPPLIAETGEAFGTAAASDAWPMSRLYRDALPAHWFDHNGTELTLDVLHVLQREPEIMDIVMTDLGDACACDPRLMAQYAGIEALLQEPRYLDGRGRLLVEALATTAAGALLKAHAPPAVSEAYIVSRFAGAPRRSYGQGLDWSDNEAIVVRALAAGA